MVGALNKKIWFPKKFVLVPLAKAVTINNCLFTFNHQVSLVPKAKLDERRQLFYCIKLESKQIIQRQIAKVFRHMPFLCNRIRERCY